MHPLASFSLRYKKISDGIFEGVDARRKLLYFPFTLHNRSLKSLHPSFTFNARIQYPIYFKEPNPNSWKKGKRKRNEFSRFLKRLSRKSLKKRLAPLEHLSLYLSLVHLGTEHFHHPLWNTRLHTASILSTEFKLAEAGGTINFSNIKLTLIATLINSMVPCVSHTVIPPLSKDPTDFRLCLPFSPPTKSSPISLLLLRSPKKH